MHGHLNGSEGTEHGTNQSTVDYLGITCVSLLNFKKKKKKLSYFRHIKRRIKEEINVRRKMERQKEEDQRDIVRRMWRTG